MLGSLKACKTGWRESLLVLGAILLEKGEREFAMFSLKREPPPAPILISGGTLDQSFKSG